MLKSGSDKRMFTYKMNEKAEAQKYFTAILRSSSMNEVIEKFEVSRERIIFLMYKYFPRVFHDDV